MVTHAIPPERQEKEHYAQLTEVENEKRRREHILDTRDRTIADWEEEEAKRRGLMGQSVLEASTEHLRGLLLEVKHVTWSLLPCRRADGLFECVGVHERAP